MDKEELANRILHESWTVEIDPNATYQCESFNATMFDNEEKEVEFPKCEKCNEYKQCIIGKESFKWLCMNCDREERGFGRF